MSNHSNSLSDIRSNYLQADCESCFGLCCVALPFAASADFAFEKDGGTPCQNLQSDFRCGIHQELRKKGFRGCTVYECFGAGQKVSQVTFGGNDWREKSDAAETMFKIFPIMQQLHEMLWYLTEALTVKAAHSIYENIRKAIDKTDQLTLLSPDFLIHLDVSAHRADVNGLLLRASELMRDELHQKFKSSEKKQKTFGPRADLVGAKLKKANLRGANLRGAYLIAADLREADMRYSDLIGADFRDADLRGTDLTGCIFLTQDQINSAKGDTNTKLPSTLTYPSHWFSS